MTQARIRRRVVVSGRVQGVAFRAATLARADACGVAGWVRNRRDGSVEAAFEGEAEAVEALVSFCRAGPRLARVERVDVFEEAPDGVLGFDVRY